MYVKALLFVIFCTPFICARTYSWIIPLTVILIFIFFFFFLLRFFITKRHISIFSGYPYSFNLSVCLFVSAIVLSTIFSNNIYLSVVELIKILSGISLCYMTAFVLKDKKEYSMKVLLLASLIIALYGFYQYFIGFSDTMKYIESNELNISANELVEIKNNLNSKRIFSTFLYPNSYAGYLIMIIPLALGFLFSAIKLFLKDKLTKFKILFLVILNLILIVSLILTRSVGGLICVLFSLIVFYLMITGKTKLFYGIGKYKTLLTTENRIYDKVIAKRFSCKSRYIYLLVLCVLFILLFMLLLSLRQDSIFNFHDPNNSVVSRYNYWMGAFNIIKKYPLFGTGLGTFGNMYREFKLPGWGNTEYAHNFYLQFTSETGLIGLISVLFLFFVILKMMVKNCSYTGIVVAVSGFLIHNIVDFDFYMWELNIIFWFLVGLGISSDISGNMQDSSRLTGSHPTPMAEVRDKAVEGVHLKNRICKFIYH